MRKIRDFPVVPNKNPWWFLLGTPVIPLSQKSNKKQAQVKKSSASERKVKKNQYTQFAPAGRAKVEKVKRRNLLFLHACAWVKKHAQSHWRLETRRAHRNDTFSP